MADYGAASSSAPSAAADAGGAPSSPDSFIADQNPALQPRQHRRSGGFLIESKKPQSGHYSTPFFLQDGEGSSATHSRTSSRNLSGTTGIGSERSTGSVGYNGYIRQPGSVGKGKGRHISLLAE